MGKLAVFTAVAAGPLSTLESFLTSEELQAVQRFWFLEDLRKSLRRRNIVVGRLGKQERDISFIPQSALACSLGELRN